MRNVHSSFVLASTFVLLCLSGCGGSDSPSPSPSPAPAPTGASSSGGAQQPGASSGGASSGGATTPTSACPAIIGKWVATLESGATVTMQGAQLPITGTIDISLTRDDADLPNIVDFAGTAKIVMAGQTITQEIKPASSPSGDPKDTTCDGGLHLRGQASVSPIGDILFDVDGTIDSTVTPATGKGTFSMKSAADNGATATANGNITLVRQ